MPEAASAFKPAGEEAQAENSAWAAVHTPLSPEELLAFCQEDLERLFRINPYLEFSCWEAGEGGTVSFRGRNLSQEQPFEFSLRLQMVRLNDGLLIRYGEGVKSETHFLVEPSPHGARLTVREEYRQPEPDDRESLAMVDRSLTTWAGDLQKYLINWRRWSWFAPWRLYMRKVWQPMKPMARRIAYMFWWITLVEIALILLGTGIYWAEYT